MKKSKTLHVVAAGVLAVVLGGALAGCGAPRDDSAERQVVQQQIKEDTGAAKKQLSELQGVTMQNSELSGGDAKGRPLWRISAKQIRVFNQPTTPAKADPKADGDPDDEKDKKKDKGEGKKQDDKLKLLSAQPRRAILTEARAMLYKEGKLDSTFLAPRVIVNYTPDGARMQMTGGVQANSEGGWAGKRGVVSMTAPHAEVNVKTRKVWASGGVHLTQGNGKERIFASSKQLQADASLKTTQLIGDVKATSPDGQFAAQQAAWNWETRVIRNRHFGVADEAPAFQLRNFRPDFKIEVEAGRF